MIGGWRLFQDFARLFFLAFPNRELEIGEPISLILQERHFILSTSHTQYNMTHHSSTVD